MMIPSAEIGPRDLDATDELIQINVRGMGAVGLQFTGTWAGTVSFEATMDGLTWVALNMVPSNSATAASSATANGAWTANIGGFDSVRARFSTDTSGTVTATLLGCAAAGRY